MDLICGLHNPLPTHLPSPVNSTPLTVTPILKAGWCGGPPCSSRVYTRPGLYCG